jgi:transposase
MVTCLCPRMNPIVQVLEALSDMLRRPLTREEKQIARRLGFRVTPYHELKSADDPT